MIVDKPIAFKVKILVFVFALFNCFLLNFLNLQFIRESNPENDKINTQSLVENSTIWSIDNDWYLPQAKYLKDGEGYTIDPSEPEMRVRRTPVYPIFYALHYFTFGEKGSFRIIVFTQTLLFACSALLLMMAVFNFSSNRNWAIWTGFLYGINVFVISYCFFTLTESLSPFLVVLCIYLFSEYLKQNQLKFLICTSISLAISFLCRPTSGILLVGIFLFILFKLYGSKKKIVLIYSVITITFIVSISPWVVRNYNLTGDLIIAEKYYHGSTMDFGRSHIKLREIVSVWTNPANLSTEVFSSNLRLLVKQNNEVGISHLIDKYLNSWPQYIFQSFSKESIEQDLFALAKCYEVKENLLRSKSHVLRKELLNQKCETDLYSSLSEKKDALIRDNFFRYWLITPIETSIGLMFNSSLHNFQLLTNLPGIYLIFGKGFTYIFNVILYLSLIYFLFCKSINLGFRLFVFAPVLILFIALTVFLFRYVETRYLIIINPLLFISFSFLVFKTHKLITEKFQNKD